MRPSSRSPTSRTFAPASRSSTSCPSRRIRYASVIMRGEGSSGPNARPRIMGRKMGIALFLLATSACGGGASEAPHPPGWTQIASSPGEQVWGNGAVAPDEHNLRVPDRALCGTAPGPGLARGDSRGHALSACPLPVQRTVPGPRRSGRPDDLFVVRRRRSRGSLRRAGRQLGHRRLRRPQRRRTQPRRAGRDASDSLRAARLGSPGMPKPGMGLPDCEPLGPGGKRGALPRVRPQMPLEFV